MLFLNRREVEALLDPGTLMEALGPAMAELSRGAVSMPPRAGAMIPDKDSFLAVMPVWTGASGTLSTKLVTVFPGNGCARSAESHRADRGVRFRDGRAAGRDGRHAHHRCPYRRRLRARDAAAGTARRASAGDRGVGRAGEVTCRGADTDMRHRRDTNHLRRNPSKAANLAGTVGEHA